MKKTQRTALYTGLLFILMLFTTSAQAAMVSTSDVLSNTSRTELHNKLERKEVQQQLTEMGVDPEDAIARVDSMTDEELAKINGQLETLPAGAGVSTVDLLLIIIIILLLA